MAVNEKDLEHKEYRELVKMPWRPVKKHMLHTLAFMWEQLC